MGGRVKCIPSAARHTDVLERHVVVASEPTTYKAEEWNLIEKNTLVIVDNDGQVQLDRVDYPLELNSTVNSL